MAQTVDALIEGGKATAAPPLGPALGPTGVNIGQVIAEINKKTADFKGMKVPIKVHITDDKEFSVTVGTPPVSQLIKKEAGIEKANAFCALTNGDNTNLVSAQVAKRLFAVPKVIARVYDPERARIYQSLGLDIISGTILFAAMLRDKIIESRFSSYLIETKDAGVIQLEVKDSLLNKAVKDVNLAGEFQVVAIKQMEGTIIPTPETVLKKNDVIMAIVKTASLNKVKKKFKL